MRITVYLGSNCGEDPAFRENAQALGTWIGSNGHTLVYGGSGDGLMGVLASAVLAAGGDVTGVMPGFLIRIGRAYEGLKDFSEVETMAERKNKMLELGDAYIAMPGGPGTLEEISEAISASRLRLHRKPCIFFNINNYYDDQFAQFSRMEEQGFVSRDEMRYVYNAKTLDEIIAVLERQV